MTGAIMIDVSGFTLTIVERVQLAKPSVGGVILFGRNFASITQVKTLIAEIRAINSELLIAIDHEGGRVQRFREGFTHLPAMAKLGEAYDANPEKALKQAFACGWILAAELLDVGMDFSFAPVLDIDYQNSSVIGDRAFHQNSNTIVALASKLIDGMHQAGMKCVGKHFPGHGFVAADSHLDLPIDTRTLTDMHVDIDVFVQLSSKLDAVMPAHVLYPQVDDKPAGFSPKWIKDILQKQLDFKGVVFSDDLSMQGANFIDNISDRVSTALNAGCDMVLICNNPKLVTEVIDKHWQSSKKLKSMVGNRTKLDKITHSQYLKTITNLL